MRVPDSGLKAVLQDVFLQRLTPGKSMINVTIRSNGKKLLCIYKGHTDKQITVESSKEALDWLLRGKNMVLNGPFAPEDVTFKLTDVEISRG